MATTTNFGWETPDDTDLVKDGALAIRTLGSAIDTSLVDLKGGTTGQVLSKTSNTDMDFTWVTSDDANAIQNAIVDAKGDLIAATANDTPARLAVGSDGQILTADSTTSTGLKWVTPASTTPTWVGCIPDSSTTEQTIANNTWTALTFDSEVLDTDGFHSTTSNTSRFTIPSGKAGKYLVSGSCYFNSNGTGLRIGSIYKNGVQGAFFSIQAGTSVTETSIEFNQIIDLAVADYVEFFVRQTSGGNLNIWKKISTGTTFSISFIGA